MSRGSSIAFGLFVAGAAVLLAASIGLRAPRTTPAVRAGPTHPIAESARLAPPEPSPDRRAIGVGSTGRIRGTVTDTKGAPIAPSGSALSLEQEGGRRIVTGWDSAGSFDARGLQSGRWEVRCAAPGFAAEVARVEIDPRREEGRADFVLRRERRITLRLLDANGAPLEDALTRAGLSTALTPTIEVITDGSSARTLAGAAFARAEGAALVLVEDSLNRLRLRSGERVLSTVDALEDADTTELRVDATGLREGLATLLVRLPEGESRGARVRVTGRRETTYSEEIAPEAHGASMLLPPGPAVVWLLVPGCAQTRRDIELASGSTTEFGPVALEPGFELVGRVRDAYGRPMSAPIAVLRHEPDGSSRPASVPESPRADANGRFVVRHLAAGRWSLACAWGGSSVEVEVPRSEPIELVGTWPGLSARAGSRPAFR